METKRIIERLDNYIDELQYSIRQPIVERDVGKAPIDRQKAFLLLLPLLNGERWTEEMNSAALAIGAVHAAFDAHDEIDEYDATSKEQQLTVLAGDHYSGIHYRLLASIPNFQLIRSLSEAIGRVNEVKTTLLETPPRDIEEMLELIGIVESECMIEFFHAYGFSKYSLLVETTLPLLWLQQKSNPKPQAPAKFSRLSISDHEQQHWIQILTAKRQAIIEESKFLAPDLAELLMLPSDEYLSRPI